MPNNLYHFPVPANTTSKADQPVTLEVDEFLAHAYNMIGEAAVEYGVLDKDKIQDLLYFIYLQLTTDEIILDESMVEDGEYLQ